MDRRSLGRFSVAVLAILVPATGGLIWLFRGPARAPFRNVLLISIDTCRADYLSCYGYPRQTTPHIDAVAREGVLFKNVLSPVPLTLPAHASMLTGTIPPQHGSHDNINYQVGQFNVTLAEILRDKGYATGAVISASVLDSQCGIDQGFQTYDDDFEEEHRALNINERKGDETTHAALAWLEKNKRKRFFLFLHYFDPHTPYDPPEPFASRFADNLYAGEVAYADHCAGQVIEKLRALDLYDSTVLVIAGDHGEMLGEHGEQTHGYFIYESGVKVPLLFRVPGQSQSRTVDDLAGLIDIVPTICSLLGIQPPPPVQGRDLSPFLFGKKLTTGQRYLYCESLYPTKYDANPLLAVVTDRWKYIQTTRPELYDVVNDPGESNNLVEQDPARTRELQNHLKKILESQVGQPSRGKSSMNEQAIERIQTLGYGAGRVREDFNFGQDKDDPKDLIDFHLSSAQVIYLLSEKKQAQAGRLCEKLVKQRPGFADGHVQMGKFAMDRGDFAEAIPPLSRGLELDPHHPDGHSLLGIVLSNLGNSDEAIGHFHRSLRIRPRHSETHNNLGTALRLRGRVIEAIHHFRQALQFNPQYARGHNNLGIALHSQGRLDEAIGHYREAIRIDPKDAAAHFTLAGALAVQGAPGEALTQLAEALRLKPDWPTALNLTAWILATHPDAAIRDGPAAIEHAERALRLNNRDPSALDTLAAAYAEVGDFDQATTTARRALELAIASGDVMVEPIHHRLSLYERKKTYREDAAR